MHLIDRPLQIAEKYLVVKGFLHALCLLKLIQKPRVVAYLALGKGYFVLYAYLAQLKPLRTVVVHLQQRIQLL